MRGIGATIWTQQSKDLSYACHLKLRRKKGSLRRSGCNSVRAMNWICRLRGSLNVCRADGCLCSTEDNPVRRFPNMFTRCQFVPLRVTRTRTTFWLAVPTAQGMCCSEICSQSIAFIKAKVRHKSVLSLQRRDQNSNVVVSEIQLATCARMH